MILSRSISLFLYKIAIEKHLTFLFSGCIIKLSKI